MSVVVERARSMIGARFRLQGRDPATGLDCVGLVLRAHGLPDGAAPRDYGWRTNEAAVAPFLSACFRRRDGAWGAGDVILAKLPRGRLHLAIWTGDGLIHADAGLGCICERPGLPPWPVIDAWCARD